MMRLALGLVAALGMAAPASAEFAMVRDKAQFLQLVQGRDLTRPLVRLRVEAAGAITGTGATRPVTGSWSWQEGYFCRDLIWGGEALGTDCQAVHADGDRIRFTAGKGSGEMAEFRLR